MTVARRFQVDSAVTPYYHCISRCVRRAFLCGEGKEDGKKCNGDLGAIQTFTFGKANHQPFLISGFVQPNSNLALSRYRCGRTTGPSVDLQKFGDSVDSCQDRLEFVFVHRRVAEMARTNRRDVLADGEIQVVHCINRCVRRAYLCGHDPLTGANYEHRRELIRHRMEYLAGIMGIEVLGYSVMSNHFHCILRSRHDVVETWSDEDVARKWWLLCPARKVKDGSPAEPTKFELNSIRNDKAGLKEKRVRLSSVSWFRQFLSERVAKEANKQDQCSGRFWEGRFKSQILLDDAAILACLQYVDLNPVRAKIATSPESSDFTSAQDRIVDAFGECAVGRVQCSGEGEEAPSSGLSATFSPDAGEKGQAEEAPSSGVTATFSSGAGEKGQGESARDNGAQQGPRAGWLVPIELREECSVGSWQCSVFSESQGR